jgi:hypothetical protein
MSMEAKLTSWHGSATCAWCEKVREFVTADNGSIATGCNVSEMSVWKWLSSEGLRRAQEVRRGAGAIPEQQLVELRKRTTSQTTFEARRKSTRLTKERVGRVISLIEEKAGIIVRQDDERAGHRVKFASAHDLRKGCAQRLSLTRDL